MCDVLDKIVEMKNSLHFPTVVCKDIPDSSRSAPRQDNQSERILFSDDVCIYPVEWGVVRFV